MAEMGRTASSSGSLTVVAWSILPVLELDGFGLFSAQSRRVQVFFTMSPPNLR
jgi:hypothetical protein